MDRTQELSAIAGRERSGLNWLPDNLAAYFNDRYCAIDISVCNTDVECGYGVRITKRLQVLHPYNECRRCGYHSLFNPDDTNSKCNRHSYKKGWAVVFSYSLDSGEQKMSLEDAFSMFLKDNPDRRPGNQPIKALHI